LDNGGAFEPVLHYIHIPEGKASDMAPRVEEEEKEEKKRRKKNKHSYTQQILK
jgi:hypothetical protein